VVIIDVGRPNATARAARVPEDLPAAAAPLLDPAAERHALETARLFAS
jgi:urease accessory protein UreF